MKILYEILLAATVVYFYNPKNNALLPIDKNFNSYRSRFDYSHLTRARQDNRLSIHKAFWQTRRETVPRKTHQIREIGCKIDQKALKCILTEWLMFDESRFSIQIWPISWIR